MGWTGYWHGFLAPLLGLGFMVACMALMYFVMRGHVRHAEHALEILRKRFAKGEISEEEFENRRRILEA